jgi:hypothetical protein
MNLLRKMEEVRWRGCVSSWPQSKTYRAHTTKVPETAESIVALSLGHVEHLTLCHFTTQQKAKYHLPTIICA